MAARFAVVSGLSNGRGKCQNLETIAFRDKTKKLRNMVYKKLKSKYLTLRALFGKELASSTGDTPPCVKFELCKQTIFCESKHKKYFKNISG